MSIRKAETKYGIVTGAETGEQQTVFRGIPFAKPPVGALRFQAPQEPEPWEEELACLKNGPACIQDVLPGSGMEISEDCLSLNIYTPAEGLNDRLPVMVWFYGGGFQNGSNSDPEFDGAALNRRGIILVVVNYRCGVMGFFSTRELEERFGGAPNLGIQDQIAALRWVQENIAAFGGDPDNVTIFGQSAGGISVRIHLANELSQGLFQKAIVESGGGLNEADLMRPKEEYQKICEELLERQNWTVDDVMTMDASALSSALSAGARELLAGKEVGFFQPFLDGDIMKQVPGVAISRGQYADVPIICGTVCGDSWMFSRKVLPQLLEIGNPSYYRGFAVSPHQAWGQVQAEWGRKAPFYAYYFERTQPSRGEGHFRRAHFGKEAPHGSEIAYVFGTLDVRGGFQEEDYAVSGMMSDYWANFARTGNPNGEGLPEWPAYTREQPVSLHVSNEGLCAENLIQNADEQKVLNFIQSYPGMTVSLDGFDG